MLCPVALVRVGAKVPIRAGALRSPTVLGRATAMDPDACVLEVHVVPSDLRSFRSPTGRPAQRPRREAARPPARDTCEMLWTLAFDQVGVVIGDLYYVDPALDQGAKGAERGVRLELRRFERDELRGDPYSSVPIRIDEPLWRVDLLETSDSEPGSLNRAHHHPRFGVDWDPGLRVFDGALSADPPGWLAERFAAIEEVLDDAGVDVEALGADVERLRNAGPIVSAEVARQLVEVAAGRAALPRMDGSEFQRSGWL